jgi:excisionase family DNA binding protein
VLTAPPSSKVLTVTEVAARLKVSRRTVYNWLRDGKLTVALRTPGGMIRIAEDDIRGKEAEVTTHD